MDTSPELSSQERASLGLPLSPKDKRNLEESDRASETENLPEDYENKITGLEEDLKKLIADTQEQKGEENQRSDSPSGDSAKKPLDEKVLAQIHLVSLAELSRMLHEKIITPEQFDDELKRRPKATGFTSAATDTGVLVEPRNMTPAQAEDWIKTLPQVHQRGLYIELENLKRSGGQYSVSISRDWKGIYHLVKFFQQPPNIKKDAAQSVTREIRRETGKQLSRLINPDYSHNEVMNQYKLVREALPPGSSTRQALDKVDGVVKFVLTTSGISAEAANLLVNAIRGALLEAPELRYKVAALLPDDLVRQGYVVGARSLGNTLLRYIHEKYHLPDGPKQTPILVNRLDQVKPEHYRQQDAQKVGVDMRDLNRENAREFILKNVPIEKQASALETIDRLPGNTFGVQIMDAGWVRISASAREPRSYDNRPRYGSYDARK